MKHNIALILHRLNKGDFFIAEFRETSSSGAGSPQGGLMVLALSRGIPFTIKIDNFNRESNASRGTRRNKHFEAHFQI